MLWLRLFLPFAGAYFLSYLYRTANAVIGPVLSDELKLGAGDLGLLTSAYFLAFAAAQLPLGMLLDRFGARRVESALLLVAAAGAATFAMGQGIVDLAVGRGLIGLGVSACLMAAFKAFSLSFPAERQASLTGWIMTSGGLGALAATAPLEAALQLTGWREVFTVLAGLTFFVAGWLFVSVPEEQGTGRPESVATQWEGVKVVFGSAHFWRFAPLGLCLTGGFMAVQSLWSISWLMQVNGYTRAVAAEHMAGMSGSMLLAYVFIGLLATALARRGIKPVQLLGAGLSISLVTLALIVSGGLHQSYLLWLVYGTFSSFGTLAYSQAAGGFPLSLSGRANTAFNLMVFIGAFGVQWGLGLLIDLLQGYGLSPAMAHRSTFLVLLVAQAASLIWFWVAGRRRR
ncbi:MFS transporter [Accumulibacter sp.]|uniref:MFS transporter n=1 Tax=Accumulibacter sp. TaxID=2053492 RepID=UPI0025EBE4EB|nr:MFS transporter [Accumulibacter sp.]MCM8612141.1 MFS transporter [Accumulibacter sp.]MCM8635807.1 MFS transporter [Accumulibacter sp.]MCM8639556.1 MFS transporter [Accumulibacter sp.]